MRTARHRRVRVLCDNPYTVPVGRENLKEAGFQVEEAKATANMSTIRLCPVQEIDPSSKIKLQLFPVDEVTRAGLEKDGHHPYLELTLRARKRISSVLKHIKGKWGSSCIATGEPVLFPYSTLEKRGTSYRWTVNDSEVSAGELYAAIECPAVFRLKYGWYSNSEPANCSLGPKLASAVCAIFPPNAAETCPKPEDKQKSINQEMINVYHEGDQREVEVQEFKMVENDKAMQAASDEKILLCHPENHMGSEERGNDAQVQSAALWADSLTDISIGGLLSEASLMGKIDNFDSRTNGGSRQPSTLISDSLDAFISANVNSSRSLMLPPSEPPSSILDAEDTCHAFSFKRPSSSSRDFPTSSGSGLLGARQQESGPKASKIPKMAKDDRVVEFQDPDMAPSPLSSWVYIDESSLGLGGINWTDTLGPFDLGLPSKKVTSAADNISLGGLGQ